MDVQDSEQLKTTVTVATQDGVDMRFNSRELTLDLQNFSKLHLEPAMATLISGIESDVLQGVTKLTNAVVGTPGTAISTLQVPGLARAKLNQNLAPKDNNRSIQMDSVTMATLVEGLAARFHDSKQISEQYREGLVGRTAMADYYENERVWSMTNGTDVNANLAGYTMGQGNTSASVSNWAAPIVPGMVFAFTSTASGTGVKQVHPETKAAYGHNMQFVVTSTTTVSTIIFFSPPIYSTGPHQNVNAMPSGGSQILFVGDPSSTYVQHLMYHKDAYTFVTADLPLMADAARCVRKQYDGISIRCWQASDIRNDEMLTRLDILWGYAAIRAQWGCRMLGAVG
jgi:hypothetical protein